jgi:hypothetical protein
MATNGPPRDLPFMISKVRKMLRLLRSLVAHNPRGLFNWSILDSIYAEEERDLARQQLRTSARNLHD